MGIPKNDLLQGTLALLVLKSLARGPMHGYRITLHIQSVSRDVLRVEEGSLYPALHRLEDRGLLHADWKESETGREAKFYTLTKKGRKRLETELLNWERTSDAVALILRTAE